MPDRPERGNERFFDGWVVVGAVFLALMANAGFGFYGLSIYLEAITDERGLSTAAVSFATSIFFVVSAIAGRIIAPTIERRDLRPIVLLGAVLAAVGMWLIGQSTRLFTLYPSYVVFAVGVGLSGLVPCTTLVTRWFQVRRSVALSIASTGLSIGGLTFGVLASWLIGRDGIADAMPWLGLVNVIAVGVAVIGFWPSPEARGTRPDGGQAAATQGPGDGSVTYETAIATNLFRLLTAGFVLAMAAQVGGIAQIVKLGSERVDSATGPLLLSTLAGTSVVARLIGGVVAARVDLVRMIVLLAAMQAVALGVLAVGDSRGVLAIGAVLFGCTMGNLLMLQPLVLADRFGVAHYPRIFALSQLIVTGIGVAGGPYLLGLLHDLESYRTSYLAATALSATGAMVFGAAAMSRNTMRRPAVVV